MEMVGLPIVYATLIINGKKTFIDVPDNLKPQVKKVLEDMDMGHLTK